MYNVVGEKMLHSVAKSAETLAIYSDNRLQYVFSSVLNLFPVRLGKDSFMKLNLPNIRKCYHRELDLANAECGTRKKYSDFFSVGTLNVQ